MMMLNQSLQHSVNHRLTAIRDMILPFAAALACAAMPGPNTAMAQVATDPARPALMPPVPPGSYADVADVAVESATIIDARIRRAREVEAARAPGLPANLVRFYVEADVNAVLYGRDAVARRVSYILDQPRRADGRPPRISRDRVLLFARPIAVANQLQLVRPDAQLVWDAGRDATARVIALELARGAVPSQITGVSQAFHVTGTIAGESETQIFLRTANAEPVSLSILRRPGQTPQWAVAFGEIVDESATVPARRTLGWYRLACGLPRTLPAPVLTGMTTREAQVTTADYALVLADVGLCDRTPPAAAAVLPAR